MHMQDSIGILDQTSKFSLSDHIFSTSQSVIYSFE